MAFRYRALIPAVQQQRHLIRPVTEAFALIIGGQNALGGLRRFPLPVNRIRRFSFLREGRQKGQNQLLCSDRNIEKSKALRRLLPTCRRPADTRNRKYSSRSRGRL